MAILLNLVKSMMNSPMMMNRRDSVMRYMYRESIDKKVLHVSRKCKYWSVIILVCESYYTSSYTSALWCKYRRESFRILFLACNNILS